MIDQKTQIKNLDVPFRIPVDRIFSVEGFGTVITGTLIEGTMKVGDPVTVYPSRIESRIRNPAGFDSSGCAGGIRRSEGRCQSGGTEKDRPQQG